MIIFSNLLILNPTTPRAASRAGEPLVVHYLIATNKRKILNSHFVVVFRIVGTCSPLVGRDLETAGGRFLQLIVLSKSDYYEA